MKLFRAVVIAGFSIALVMGCSTSTKTATSTTIAMTTTTQTPSSPKTTVQLGGPTSTDIPPFPASIDGYDLSGPVQTEEIRVFEPDYATPLAFESHPNSCGHQMWVARWRSLNPDVLLRGAAFLYDADEVMYPTTDISSHAPSLYGYISGFGCERPVVIWGTVTNGNGSNLVDVTVEWQYYDFDASVDG
jgi:hypothetical protein